MNENFLPAKEVISGCLTLIANAFFTLNMFQNTFLAMAMLIMMGVACRHFSVKFINTLKDLSFIAVFASFAIFKPSLICQPIKPA